MSSGDLEQREEQLAAFVREMRQFHGLGASFFRAAASHIGIPVTDLQVIDMLELTGPTTAGQLAEQMALTTGAITQMLDRLEKGGLIRRERDPADGRRVIVHLAPDEEALRTIGPIFESLGQRWDQIAADYDDAQLAMLAEFLRRNNALTRAEIAQLKEQPGDTRGDFSAPLDDPGVMWRISFAGLSRLNLRAVAEMPDLYRAHFGGTVPTVNVADHHITIRYPQRLWLVDWRQRMAEVALNVSVLWRVAINGGASEISADLAGLELAELEVKGGMSSIQLTLPTPSRSVPIRISGGAADIVVHRPAGVPARIHFKGWASVLHFDHQSYSSIGNNTRLQSPDFDGATQRYDIEINGSASVITVQQAD